MDKVEIDLKLTVGQVNNILAHLARGAYADVADLVTEIRKQATPQVEKAALKQENQASEPPTEA